MMLKDLHLAADAARAAGAEIRLGEHAETIYQALSDKGLDGLDFSGVMKDVKGLIPR
jgi:3-hydroxyisobutyrate dehydrogenase